MAKDLEKEIESVFKKDISKLDKKDLELIKEYIKELKTQKAEAEEEIKHQVAEGRNSLRRRDETESELRKYSATKLGEMIIPDIDLLKKVVSSAESIDDDNVKNYLKGFEMVIAKMEETLNEVGITQMDIKLGSEFDSSIEESVEQVETDKYKSGQVVEVVSHGYKIHDRVLIHAKVKIAK